MRLIDLESFTLREFLGQDIPPYAILSHRWEEEEVNYHDFAHVEIRERMIGFNKLRSACYHAAKDGHRYLWIDTCCIDKTSSAELSEAINSMFAWYEKADVCYAYLSDVPTKASKHEYVLPNSAFRQSLWFRRGWTLQELLAPKDINFVTDDWTLIGRKSDYDMREVLSNITGIKDLENYKRASVAQKMSWMSQRTTTRVEDMAYCMLGILGVHMPPLYGEAENAFQRLQLELLRISDDESLFAWRCTPESAIQFPERSILAKSIKDFAESGDIINLPDIVRERHYEMTNKGILIHKNRALRTLQGSKPPIYVIRLNCIQSFSLICVFLKDGVGPYLHRVLPNVFARPLGLTSFVPVSARAVKEIAAEGPQITPDPSFYIREPLGGQGNREYWTKWSAVSLYVGAGILQQKLDDIIVGDERSSWWLEDGVHHYRIWLQKPIAFVFRNVTFSHHQYQVNTILLLSLQGDTLMTTLLTVPKHILNDNITTEYYMRTHTQYRNDHRSPLNPEDPTQWWTPQSWKIEMWNPPCQMRFEVTEHQGILNCELTTISRRDLLEQLTRA